MARDDTQVYAIYRGDEFIDVGTLVELSERTGIKRETLRWYSYPSSHKRDKGNKFLVYKIDMNQD